MATRPTDPWVLGAEGNESIKNGQEDGNLKAQKSSGLGINSESFFDGGPTQGDMVWTRTCFSYAVHVGRMDELVSYLGGKRECPRPSTCTQFEMKQRIRKE